MTNEFNSDQILSSDYQFSDLEKEFYLLPENTAIPVIGKVEDSMDSFRKAFPHVKLSDEKIQEYALQLFYEKALESEKKKNAVLEKMKLINDTYGFIDILKPVLDESSNIYVLGACGKRQTVMKGPQFWVGRDPTMNIKPQDEDIPDETLRFVSKRHFMIVYDEDNSVFLLVNYSQNGTLVDGFLVTTEPHVLSGNFQGTGYNEIRIGEVLLGKDPLVFTLNTCVFRFKPADFNQ